MKMEIGCTKKKKNLKFELGKVHDFCENLVTNAEKDTKTSEEALRSRTELAENQRRRRGMAKGVREEEKHERNKRERERRKRREELSLVLKNS